MGFFYYIARFVGGFYYILFLVMCQHNLYKGIVVGKLEHLHLVFNLYVAGKKNPSFVRFSNP